MKCNVSKYCLHQALFVACMKTRLVYRYRIEWNGKLTIDGMEPRLIAAFLLAFWKSSVFTAEQCERKAKTEKLKKTHNFENAAV